MKKSCDKYTSEDISRFIDNELPQGQYPVVAQHLVHCRDCSRLAERYRSISAVINDHADQEVLKIDPARLKQKIVHTIQNSKEKSFLLST